MLLCSVRRRNQVLSVRLSISEQLGAPEGNITIISVEENFYNKKYIIGNDFVDINVDVEAQSLEMALLISIVMLTTNK